MVSSITIANLFWPENKDYTATGVMKPATVPAVITASNTVFESLPLPNEILVKIFGYLDIQDISRSARVCHQFNMISKDTSLWKSLEKIGIDERKVPTEFLEFILQRGITELSLFKCKILPPRARLTRPLNLKVLSLDETKGDKTLLNELISSHPMEKVDLRDSISPNFSLFIKSQIGSQLKSLNLQNGLLGRYGNLGTIALIVNTCLGLEELNLSCNRLKDEAIDYLCENLTPTIRKLNINGLDGLTNENLMKLVKRCPNLKVLDIRGNEKVTFLGLVAIIEQLHYLEYLGLPESIETELGLPNNINLSKMGRLKSMKNLKELLIGDDSEDDEYQNILKREIPHLRKHEGGQIFRNMYNDLEVAMTNTKDYRGVQFCPNCHEYKSNVWWSLHKC